MVTLVQGAVDFPDIPTQKSCFLVLRKLIECQCEFCFYKLTKYKFDFAATAKTDNLNSMKQSTNGGCQASPTNIPSPLVLKINETAFVEFCYKNIVPACFFAPLKQVDGDVNSMLNEVVMCLKAIQSFRGDDEFLTFLQQQYLNLHFPTFTGSNEMVQSFLASDSNRSLKEVFRKFIHQFKK